jgi:hypothetical protein
MLLIHHPRPSASIDLDQESDAHVVLAVEREMRQPPIPRRCTAFSGIAARG